MRKKVIMMIVAFALMVLPAMAQNFGKPYMPTYNQVRKQQVMATSATPSAAFQSTSVMSGSGSSYSANPTLNNDGTATYENAAHPSSQNSGPRRAKMDGEWGDSGLGDLPGGPGTPIGDVLIPLLLLVLAYAGYKVRVRREAEMEK